jgi:hypothetical protein
LAVVLEAGVVARRVTVDACSMVLVRTLEGLALGTASVRYIETLFYQVKAIDLVMLAFPSVTSSQPRYWLRAE